MHFRLTCIVLTSFIMSQIEMDGRAPTYITPSLKAISLHIFVPKSRVHLFEYPTLTLCCPLLRPSLPSCPSSASLGLPRYLSLLPLGPAQ